MKIIHCADIHLGSAMDLRFPPEKAEERRRELRAAFSSLAEYAKSNGVAAVIIAGDLFDSGRPLKRDKEFFYGVVKNNPQTDFLYLRGNHDEQQSYTEAPQNLKTFSEEWQYYSYGDTVIGGIEITPANRTSLYTTLKLDGNKTNIVTLHGQTGGEINLPRLAGKNIDYLALGHIHSFSQGALDARGIYAYSGCLEGRGFDEAGEKGFVLLDIQNGEINAKFVPFAKRTVRVAEFNITGAEDGYAVCDFINKNLPFPQSDIIRVVLKGETDFDNSGLEKELRTRLERSGRYYADVKNQTYRRLDLNALAGEVSLRGEFVRLVLADNIPDEKKREVISLGLRALEGRELDI